MLGFLRRLIGRQRFGPHSLLSAKQACEIAERAVTGTYYAGKMTFSKLENRDGKLIWLISSVTKGSGVIVTVDDATGELMHNERWGIR